MTDVQAGAPTVTVTLDGTEIQAAPGELVIAAAERNGVYIPRFCYHPRMAPVGMCRMCLVEIDTGRGPALQPSCMISVSDGMVVDTAGPVSQRAQEGVLELLLINHPLDCPVCDKGGECPLQDQTMAYGPGETRFIEQKRTFAKPIPISELVYLDRERCILCDRCTRFADEVAGDPLIHFMERGGQTQVLTFPEDPFNSYFSGNTVQICPVGALTAKPYRFKARPWDLEEVESTCTSCSVGCRVAVQSSRNQLVRYMGVDVDPVNWGWLCDRGRFDFEWINSEHRLAGPLVRDPADDAFLVGTSWAEALRAAAAGIRSAIESGGPGSVAVIGGARLTNEAAYAWSKLARSVIGTDHVDAQLGDGLPADAVLALPRATIDEACSADTLLVLGPDVKERLPVLYLRLRHAAVRDGVRIIEITPTATGLTPHAHRTIHHLPGNAVGAIRELLARGEDLGRVVVIAGRASLAGSADDVCEAIGLVRDRLPDATFLPALPRGNVAGALDMGLAPGILPGRVSLDGGRDWYAARWGSVPAEAGLDTRGILDAAASGRIGAMVLLGADPLVDFPDRDLAERGLAGAGLIVAVDTFVTDSVQRADVVLAAAAYAEQGGTTTNLEGRVSRLAQRVTPPGTVRPDWMIAAELAALLGGDLGMTSHQAIWAEIAEVVPSHRGIDSAMAAPGAGRIGLVVPLDPPPAGDDPLPEPITWDSPTPSDVAAPANYALRLAVGRKLYDQATSVAMSPSLAGLAPEAVLRLSPGDVDRLGIAPGERVQVEVRGGRTLVVPCRPDPGVPRGVAALAYLQPGAVTAELLDSDQRFIEVRVDTRAAGRSAGG